MSNVHSFVLITPAGMRIAPSVPRLPWSDAIVPEAPKVARWFRADLEMWGDGEPMSANVRVFGLVVKDRDPQLVIDAFRGWSTALDHSMGEAVLTVKRQQSDHVEIYSSRDGAPRLLGSVRERGRGGLL